MCRLVVGNICIFSLFNCRLLCTATSQFVTFFLFLKKKIQNSLLSPQSGATVEPRLEKLAASSPTLARLSSASPFHFRGWPTCYVDVASTDAYVVQLGDFPELTQNHFRNSTPLRGRVAQVNRGRCVRAFPLLMYPPEHRPDHHHLKRAVGVHIHVPCLVRPDDQYVKSEGVLI